MPLYAAKKALENADITAQELFERIGQTNIEIGNLYCRCGTDPQLTSDLVELEEIAVKLTKKYQQLLKDQNANPTNQPKNS